MDLRSPNHVGIVRDSRRIDRLLARSHMRARSIRLRAKVQFRRSDACPLIEQAQLDLFSIRAKHPEMDPAAVAGGTERIFGIRVKMWLNGHKPPSRTAASSVGC